MVGEDARPLLEVDGVRKAFGSLVAVDDVSFPSPRAKSWGSPGRTEPERPRSSI